MGFIRDKLRTLTEAFTDSMYNSSYPRAQVREKLEAKGYSFKFNIHACGRSTISYYDVKTPSGHTIGWKGGPNNKVATALYLKAYNKALEEFKQERAMKP